MIRTEIVNGIIHTYSDAGLKIRMKDTGWVVKSGHAYEAVNGKRHEYEEVPNDETGSN